MSVKGGTIETSKKPETFPAETASEFVLEPELLNLPKVQESKSNDFAPDLSISISYVRENGEAYTADSAEQAIKLCPYLGRIARESPTEAQQIIATTVRSSERMQIRRAALAAKKDKETLPEPSRPQQLTTKATPPASDHKRKQTTGPLHDLHTTEPQSIVESSIVSHQIPIEHPTVTPDQTTIEPVSQQKPADPEKPDNKTKLFTTRYYPEIKPSFATIPSVAERSSPPRRTPTKRTPDSPPPPPALAAIDVISIETSVQRTLKNPEKTSQTRNTSKLNVAEPVTISPKPTPALAVARNRPLPTTLSVPKIEMQRLSADKPTETIITPAYIPLTETIAPIKKNIPEAHIEDRSLVLPDTLVEPTPENLTIIEFETTPAPLPEKTKEISRKIAHSSKVTSILQVFAIKPSEKADKEATCTPVMSDEILPALTQLHESLRKLVDTTENISPEIIDEHKAEIIVHIKILAACYDMIVDEPLLIEYLATVDLSELHTIIETILEDLRSQTDWDGEVLHALNGSSSGSVNISPSDIYQSLWRLLCRRVLIVT